MTAWLMLTLTLLAQWAAATRSARRGYRLCSCLARVLGPTTATLVLWTANSMAMLILATETPLRRYLSLNGLFVNLLWPGCVWLWVVTGYDVWRVRRRHVPDDEDAAPDCGWFV